MAQKTDLSDADKNRLKDQLLKELKPALHDYVRQEVRRQLGEKTHERQVQEVTLDVLFKFFRNLANRNAFFKGI